MDKRTFYTWALLLVFTILAGIVSRTVNNYAVVVILALSAIKFMGVAFEFMDLKVAHNFWKIAVTAYVLIFMGIILIII